MGARLFGSRGRASAAKAWTKRNSYYQTGGTEVPGRDAQHGLWRSIWEKIRTLGRAWKRGGE